MESSNYFQYSSEFIGIASITIAGFGIIVTAIGFFSYYQYQKISTIREQARDILETEKSKLAELALEQSIFNLDIISGFNNIYFDINKTFIEANKYVLNIFGKDSEEYEEQYQERMLSNYDLINNIKLITSVIESDIQIALYSIQAAKKRTLVPILDLFIEARKNDYKLNDQVRLAIMIKKNL
jgi:hypothetical protein